MRHLLTIILLLLLCPVFAKPSAMPPPVVPQCFGFKAIPAGATDADLERWEAIGFGWAGLEFRWADVEKATGSYDFTETDATLARFTAHQLKPLFILDGANSLYPAGPTSSAAFSRFLTAAVRRYQGRPVIWQVGTGVSTQQAVKTIKAVDPDAAIVMDADLKASPEDASDDEALRRLIQTDRPLGKDISLLTTVEDAQTQPLIRHLLSDLADGICLSLCADDSGDASAVQAMRTLTRTLNGYRFIKRVPLTSPDDHLLLFGRGTDGVKVVAWTAGPDHTILLPITAIGSMTGMTGESLSAVPAAGRLSLPLTGAPIYLDVRNDAALRQAGAWAAASSDLFYTQGQPLRLALTYHNPDGVAHRVRFVALLTTPDGTRSPLPAGEDIVGPHQSLTLGIQTPALAGSMADVRIGLVLDGGRQPYPQDVTFVPLTPLALTIAPLTASQTQVQIENPSGLAFVGSLNATAPGGVTTVPVNLQAGQTAATVTVRLPPGTETAWRLRDTRGRLASTLPEQRFVPYPLSMPDVRPLLGESVTDIPDMQITQSQEGGAQRIRYRFAPGQSSWQIGEEQPLALPGRPVSYGLWVYGDGGGAQLSMDFEDSVGQTYTADGERLTWVGWRFVAFPLRKTGAAVEYPLKITAILRLQSTSDARTRAGTLLWKEPAVIYEAATLPHRV